jgi:hypothetical protein
VTASNDIISSNIEWVIIFSLTAPLSLLHVYCSQLTHSWVNLLHLFCMTLPLIRFCHNWLVCELLQLKLIMFSEIIKSLLLRFFIDGDVWMFPSCHISWFSGNMLHFSECFDFKFKELFWLRRLISSRDHSNCFTEFFSLLLLLLLSAFS